MKNETRSYSITIAFSIFAFAIFVTAGLSLFSGPGLAPAYIVVSVLPLFYFLKSKNWQILYNGILQKVIITILLYSLISCAWVIDPAKSLKLWARMLGIAISAFILFDFVKTFSSSQKEKLLKAISVGVALAIILAIIEIVTDGFITKLIRFYQPDHIFKLTDLNRGSGFLSLMFWPCLSFLIAKGYKLYAAIFGILIFAVISQLESMSALLGLIMGVIICGIIYKIGRKGIKLIIAGVIFGIIIIPTITSITTAEKLNNTIPVIPGAASEYRIYIWDFAGNKALEKPIFGWGFDASRKIPVKDSDFVLGGRHPLPLHTHNNTIQVWLELGIVGLILFAAFLISILNNIQKLKSNQQMSLCTGLFSTYFIIGQTGYGIWQSWWVAGGLLATTFLLASFTHSSDQSASKN